MAERTSDRLEIAARSRIARYQAEIDNSLTHRDIGNPLGGEPDAKRLVDRLMTRNLMSHDEAVATAEGIRSRSRAGASGGEAMLLPGAEAIWGPTIDFTPISFLERGKRAARAVGRVRLPNGYGSGFIVAPGLFLTNNHVLTSEQVAANSTVEFDYELDLADNPSAVTRFNLDPASCFVCDRIENLDFTLVAIGTRHSGQHSLETFGHCRLSAARDKHAIGEVVNVVQHPQGRMKEVVLRENMLVARTDTTLLYMADTEPGSSGSPVYNNQWQPVALHHWGGPYRALRDPANARIPREVNEGIRISAIVAELTRRAPGLAEPFRARVAAALALWGSEAASAPSTAEETPAPSAGFGMRSNPDGTATWSFPVEITVGVPFGRQSAPPNAPAPTADTIPPLMPSSEKALAPSDDYSDRGGYEPGFIPGFVVPLPVLSKDLERLAARNSAARRGENPFELRYHHFSAAVNAERKLAFYTACNIDGARSKYINRNTGDVEPLDPANPDHGLSESLLGAEATEKWYDDDRLSPQGSIVGQAFYDKQNVPGFPTSTKMQRTKRMFQRGHLVRRLDPAWGDKNEALLAEADTFHFVNCAPQIGFFNMGAAAPNTPLSGGGKLWRAVENIVLRNARVMRTRVSSFTGPIFADDDPPARGGVLVPMRFFKIVAWADDGGLRALAMIADQSGVIEVWPESLLTEGAAETFAALGEEAFQDDDELSRVDDFLATVEDIETLTGLDFGPLRDADIRANAGPGRPATENELSLSPQAPAPRKRAAAAKKRAPAKRGRAAPKKAGARKVAKRPRR